MVTNLESKTLNATPMVHHPNKEITLVKHKYHKSIMNVICHFCEMFTNLVASSMRSPELNMQVTFCHGTINSHR